MPVITPPDQPDNRGSYYTCGCGVIFQAMRRVEDETGEPVLALNIDNELVEQHYNDEAIASAELNAHVAVEHPPEIAE